MIYDSRYHAWNFKLRVLIDYSNCIRRAKETQRLEGSENKAVEKKIREAKHKQMMYSEASASVVNTA